MKTQADKHIQRLSFKLALLAFLMFMFCLFVLPPLYQLFCEVTGLNGKTSNQAYIAKQDIVDHSRNITINFIAVSHNNHIWTFSAPEQSLVVHPGQITTTKFRVENTSGRWIAVQAVPSMVPINATNYFNKTECFCFNRQILAPGEQSDLGLQFIVDSELPKAIKSLTLSYTLFDISEASSKEIQAEQQHRIGLNLSRVDNLITLPNASEQNTEGNAYGR
ncbi:cytochrome c oxidase assembly protein [Agaribacterium haliotis]|uniref:cytochrome c oxidase assembly protein n=1 Tax=Agaribacterium haliotis TaxID=2013869 RepID=UPI00130437CB|nr:cytochrome c oxidase assembly protein [Agaribacterium haliotis]